MLINVIQNENNEYSNKRQFMGYLWFLVPSPFDRADGRRDGSPFRHIYYFVPSKMVEELPKPIDIDLQTKEEESVEEVRLFVFGFYEYLG